MKYLIDYTNYPSSDYTYGGNGGLKHGIMVDNEPWFIKFPWKKEGALKEFIGSNIFKILGFDVQETKLGYYINKTNKQTYLVVACKDFCCDKKELITYLMFRNHHNYKLEEAIYHLNKSLPKYKDNSVPTISFSIEQALLTFKYNDILKLHPEFEKFFWKQFIVDCLIGNRERTINDFGMLRDITSNNYTLAPIFDNDECFSKDESCYCNINSEVVDYPTFFNILKAKKLDNGLNEALISLIPIIKDKINDITNFIYSISNKEDIEILTEEKKKEYVTYINNRFNNILLPLYKGIK